MRTTQYYSNCIIQDFKYVKLTYNLNVKLNYSILLEHVILTVFKWLNIHYKFTTLLGKF